MVAIKIADHEELDRDLLMSVVSAERRAKVSRLHFESDRVASLLAAAVARWMLQVFLGVPNSALDMRTDPGGKPFCVNLRDIGGEFNMSHTRGCVACGVAPGRIGVDVEVIRPVTVADLSPVLHSEEIDELSGATNEALIRAWTLREAYMKYLGMGLSQPPGSFRIARLAEEQPQVQVRGVPQTRLRVVSARRGDAWLATVSDTEAPVVWIDLREFQADLRRATRMVLA